MTLRTEIIKNKEGGSNLFGQSRHVDAYETELRLKQINRLMMGKEEKSFLGGGSECG